MLGLEIKKMRKQLLLTQEEFGKLFGVSSQSIYYWEKEICRPNTQQLMILLKMFEHYKNPQKNNLFLIVQEAISMPMFPDYESTQDILEDPNLMPKYGIFHFLKRLYE